MYLSATEETVSYKNNLNFRIMKNTTAANYPAHWHTALELITPIENIYTVEISGNIITLLPGDIFLISSGELHSLSAPSDGSRIIIQIDYSMLAGFEDFPTLLSYIHPYLWINRQKMPALHAELSALLHALTEEYFSCVPLKETAAFASLLRFFIILGRTFLWDTICFPDLPLKKQQEYKVRFHEVLAYMNTHYTENPDVSELAAITGFSVSHFTRLFKQYTNMSWYTYLNRQKIMHVERLLASSGLSMTEIAMQSGFNSLATFNRIFKAEKHCTPSEYRSKYRF